MVDRGFFFFQTYLFGKPTGFVNILLDSATPSAVKLFHSDSFKQIEKKIKRTAMKYYIHRSILIEQGMFSQTVEMVRYFNIILLRFLFLSFLITPLTSPILTANSAGTFTSFQWIKFEIGWGYISCLYLSMDNKLSTLSRKLEDAIISR